MSKYNNIEDIFKNAFQTYSEKPDKDVWKGIAPKLSGARLELLYKTAFKGFTSSPSQAVWKKIASSMWIKNFVHFNPLSFNAYYMAALSIVGVTSFVVFNNQLNLGSIDKITAEKHSQINIEEFYEYGDISSNIIVPDKIPVQSNEMPSLVSYTDLKEDAELSYFDEKIITEEEFKTEELYADEIFDTKHDAKDISSQQFDYYLKRLNLPIISKLSYSPDLFESLEQYFSNLLTKDISIYDTLGVDYKGDDIVIKRDYFELSAFFGSGKSIYSIGNANSELQNQFDNYKSNIYPEISYYAGLGLSYNYRRFHLETGLHYNYHQETGVAELLRKTGVEVSSYDYFEDSFWQTDTLAWILDLDQYLAGNIVYIPYTDSSFITVTDSVLVTQIDSVEVLSDVNYSNQYHIIGVPVIFGYEFTSNKISFTPKSGLIAGFLINQSGKHYNIEQNNLIPANMAPNSKILLDYYGAINIKYKLFENISLFAEPNVRGSIIPMYQQQYAISKRAYRFGVNAGISIRL